MTEIEHFNKFTIFILNNSRTDVYVVKHTREVFDTPVWNNIYTKLCSSEIWCHLFWCTCTEMHSVIAQSPISEPHVSCLYCRSSLSAADFYLR